MYSDMIEVTLPVKKFAADLELEIMFSQKEEITLNTVNVSRPGLQLAGFFDYFGANRIQVLGNAEMQFIKKMSYEERVYSLTQFFKYPMPCIILAKNIEAPAELIEIAQSSGVPMFKSDFTTTTLVNHIVMYLNKLLAPTVTMHAGLIDVYGVGLLLIGKSGIGKSETALELVKKA